MRPHGPGLISLRVPALSPLPGLEGGWGALLSTELREHVTAESSVDWHPHAWWLWTAWCIESFPELPVTG